MAPSPLRNALPLLLSLNAGFVDTAGFLALQGLFTAHVTGNFVTLGASLVLGTSGAVAKLLALPVFCLVVVLTRLLSSALLPRFQQSTLRIILAIKVVLLALGAGLAIQCGPFARGDAWQAVLTGMVLVAAMAIQNAAHRIHLGSAPPSTLMTGTTTQIMIDLADMLQGPNPGTGAAGPRLLQMSTNVLVFAIGCAAAAFLYAWAGPWCFLVPPLLGAAALFLRAERA